MLLNTNWRVRAWRERGLKNIYIIKPIYIYIYSVVYTYTHTYQYTPEFTETLTVFTTRVGREVARATDTSGLQLGLLKTDCEQSVVWGVAQDVARMI